MWSRGSAADAKNSFLMPSLLLLYSSPLSDVLGHWLVAGHCYFPLFCLIIIASWV